MSKYRQYNRKRRDGFGMNLYRNTKRGKLGGVCAGLADHFEIDPNIMRIGFIAALVFSGTVAFWAYIIFWVVLCPRGEDPGPIEYEYDEDEHCYKKKKMFRYRKPVGDRLNTLNERLKSIVSRVENMERYVTSKRFDLDRKFADLDKS